jgi:hypothetical protein
MENPFERILERLAEIKIAYPIAQTYIIVSAAQYAVLSNYFYKKIKKSCLNKTVYVFGVRWRKRNYSYLEICHDLFLKSLWSHPNF